MTSGDIYKQEIFEILVIGIMDNDAHRGNLVVNPVVFVESCCLYRVLHVFLATHFAVLHNVRHD